jgi:hypothetical protein
LRGNDYIPCRELLCGTEMDEIILTTPEKIKEIVTTCLAEFLTINTSTGPPDKEDEYLKSVKDIANFLGCSSTTAQKFKNQNRQIFLQIGRKFLVRKTDIIDTLKFKSKYYGH